VGAEIVLFYFLPAGAVLGAACALWVWSRSRRVGWERLVLVAGTFALGLVLPTLLLLAAGLYFKLTQPQPKLTHLLSLPIHSTATCAAGAAVRSNLLFQPTASGGG
jgi:di/tricarboxylate transporter